MSLNTLCAPACPDYSVFFAFPVNAAFHLVTMWLCAVSAGDASEGGMGHGGPWWLIQGEEAVTGSQRRRHMVRWRCGGAEWLTLVRRHNPKTKPQGAESLAQHTTTLRRLNVRRVRCHTPGRLPLQALAAPQHPDVNGRVAKVLWRCTVVQCLADDLAPLARVDLAGR